MGRCPQSVQRFRLGALPRRAAALVAPPGRAARAGLAPLRFAGLAPFALAGAAAARLAAGLVGFAARRAGAAFTGFTVGLVAFGAGFATRPAGAALFAADLAGAFATWTFAGCGFTAGFAWTFAGGWT